MCHRYLAFLAVSLSRSTHLSPVSQALSATRSELDDLIAKSTSETRGLSEQLASSGVAAASTAKAHEGQIATLQQSVAALSLTVEESETVSSSTACVTSRLVFF